MKPKPHQIDAQGYGTWAYRNRRVIIKSVYGVGSSNHGYRYKIAGHFHYIPCGRGWNTLERCLHFAALRIDRLVDLHMDKRGVPVQNVE